ncbi:MAG: DUF3828 domain-containing protein [Nitrospirae bacterium]|nr:DUF3828 domain-containing protein [Nitrospirota bacterium]
MKRLTMLIATAVAIICLTTQVTDAKQKSPKDVILKLYSDHQPKYQKEINWKDKNILTKYLSPELVDLFMKDDECTKKYHGVCNLNFDPFYDAQDYDDKPLNLKIKEVKSNRSMCEYRVSFFNITNIALVYRVVTTTSGWKIDDIVYPNGSTLKQTLSIPIDDVSH